MGGRERESERERECERKRQRSALRKKKEEEEEIDDAQRGNGQPMEPRCDAAETGEGGNVRGVARTTFFSPYHKYFFIQVCQMRLLELSFLLLCTTGGLSCLTSVFNSPATVDFRSVPIHSTNIQKNTTILKTMFAI